MNNPKRGKNGHGRRPLTRDMLLPFNPAQVRALSLPSHLALISLRRGEGDIAHVRRLAEVVCSATVLSERWAPEVDQRVLDDADQVIRRLPGVASQNERLSIDSMEGEMLARALTIHDQLLERLPCHRYFDALEQVERAVNQRSPELLER